jgi:tetratricopeptide (TPR) repeat protein
MKQFFVSLFQSNKESKSDLLGKIFLSITILLVPVSFILVKIIGITSIQGLLFTGIVWIGLLVLLISLIIRGKFVLPKRYSLYVILALISYVVFQVIAFSSVHFSFGTTSSFLDHPLFVISLFLFVVILSLMSVGYVFLQRALFVLGILMSVSIIHTLLVGIFGFEFLSLGSTASSGLNVFGSWVDLSTISFLLLISSFTYSFFTENSFQEKSMWIFGVVGLLGMIVTNSYLGWVLLGLFSLGAIFIAFSHTEHNWQNILKKNTVLVIPVILFVVSLFFIVGNSFISQPIQSFSGVVSQEVRLSLSATYDILTKSTLSEIITGSGLGTFEQTWFKHVDARVSQTALWNTGFSFTFGYVPTFLFTFGIIGLLLLILFFVAVVFEGYQALAHSRKEDRGIISVVYVTTLFALPLLVFSIPGLFVLVLLFTGIGILLGYSYSSVKQNYVFDVFSLQPIWKRFVSVGIVLVLVVVCVYVLFSHIRYVTSLRMVQKSVISLQGNNPEFIVSYLQRAQLYAGNSYDVHVMITRTALAVLQSSDQEKMTQEFVQNILQTSLKSLGRAIAIQPYKHQPYVLLGDFHMFLYQAGLVEALPIAMESYQKSLDFRPYNPYVLLAQARELFVNNSLSEGRLKLDALFTLRSFDASFFREAGLLEEQFGSLIRAEAYFKQATSLERNTLSAWMQLVSFYSRSGSLDKAQETLEFLVTTYPQNIDVRILIARFFVETGNRASAQEHIDFLKQYENNIPQLGEFLIRLQNDSLVIPGAPSINDILEENAEASDNEDQFIESDF